MKDVVFIVNVRVLVSLLKALPIIAMIDIVEFSLNLNWGVAKYYLYFNKVKRTIFMTQFCQESIVIKY
ncbi:hypothetical protein [Lysinibacillus sp. 54212]|uniref:hypothetical protein n=1 Tax=Lysinibacillus sp. 54212 TaxID=3119829 RepID=UPI002FCB69A6